MINENIIAPEFDVDSWINTDKPLSLSVLRGKVVVVYVFQMLCPGCVLHSMPQASTIYEFYKDTDVRVIGLHSVFEHHAVMDPDALKVFIDEFRIRFPVAVDKPAADNEIPLTMQKYALRGTPSLLLIDRQGKIRLNHFGRLNDLQLGNAIGQLLAEAENFSTGNQAEKQDEAMTCSTEGCLL